jgi:hypothetical protein
VNEPRLIDGILVLYNHPIITNDAATILDHVNSFGRYSRHAVWAVNTELGLPAALKSLRFRVIVLHYSLFGMGYRYHLNDDFTEFLTRSAGSSEIVGVFQDEYHHCRKRFAFIDRYKVDTILTCIDPAYYGETYGKHTRARKIQTVLTGYVSEHMVAAAKAFAKPEDQRAIDVGYRARQLAYYMGRGAQEKAFIGAEFKRRAAGLPLRLDIESEEKSRIYGDDYYRFLGNCVGSLGVESGVSIIDVNDTVRETCEKMLKENPAMTFQELYDRYLHTVDDKLPVRTISPRHFEAAAFRVCQILFEGHYNGIMKPMVHYLPLKKDFSNFDEIIRLFSDKSVRAKITGNAYRDLIESGNHTFEAFVRSFDALIAPLGLAPRQASSQAEVERLIRSDHLRRLPLPLLRWFNGRVLANYPGREQLKRAAKRIPALRSIFEPRDAS